MASPVGHSLAGLSLYLFVNRRKNGPEVRADWRTVALFAVAANLPDLDFLIGYVAYGDPNRIHGGWTHAAPFAAAAAVGLTGLHRFGPSVMKTGLIYFAAVFSHGCLDLFTGPVIGIHPSYGVNLLWPFVHPKIRAPVTFFQGTRHRTLDQLVSEENLWGVLYELCVFVPLILGMLYLFRNDRRPAR